MVEMQHRTQQKTIIMEIPLVILYAILPLMGIMMLIRAIQVIYQDIMEQRACKKQHYKLNFLTLVQLDGFSRTRRAGIWKQAMWSSC